jgi:putative glycosyltransferase (TIGR04372 family)
MSRFKLAINSIWAVPIVVIIRVIRPIVLIRICRIFSERIGHFTADISEHIVRRNLKPPRTIDLFYFGSISNQQWHKMARRTPLIFCENWLGFVDRWNRILPGGSSHLLKSSLTQSRDVGGLFERFDGSIPFLESENSLGIEWLKSKGWTPGEPFICLLVRDSKFLEHMRVFSSNGEYHDYRDSEISTYAASMEWLASRGVWVIRMGKLMDKPFHTNSKQIIDYAFDDKKTDLLDIWLFANSNGVISTGTGLDQLAAIYRKPHLYLNAMPLGKMHSWEDMIWIPKNLRWRETKKPLTLNQYLEHNYSQLHEYHLAGIEIVDLTSQEIFAGVREFWMKLTGLDRHSKMERELQDNFWSVFKSWSEFNRYHRVIHQKASVGTEWLANLSKKTSL